MARSSGPCTVTAVRWRSGGAAEGERLLPGRGPAGPSFGEDAADVGLDGPLADRQVPGDPPVAATAGDQTENFAFARRERAGAHPVAVACAAPGRAGVSSSGLRLAVPAAASWMAVMRSGGEAVWSKVGGRVRVHGPHEAMIVGGGGEHDNGRPVRRIAECRDHGVPVQPGHIQVEEQHVRAGGGDDVGRSWLLRPRRRHLDYWFLAEQEAQPVLDPLDWSSAYHHADRHGTGTRTVSCGAVPWRAVDVQGAAEFGDPVRGCWPPRSWRAARPHRPRRRCRGRPARRARPGGSWTRRARRRGRAGRHWRRPPG